MKDYGTGVRRWLLLVPFLFLAAAFYWVEHRTPELLALPLPDAALLQKGDWIFRSGRSADSLLIKQLSGGAYSHIGIISRTEPEIRVVHAVSGEGGAYPDAVIEMQLAEFLSAERADAAAVARPRFLNRQQRIAAADFALGKIGVPFSVEVRDTPHYYCTTLVLDAANSQSAALNPDWTTVDIAVFGGRYLFPEAFRTQDLEWIYRFPEP